MRRHFAEEAEEEVVSGACEARDACTLCSLGCVTCRPRWLFHVRLLQGFADVLDLQIRTAEVWATAGGGDAGEPWAGATGGRRH